MRRLKIWERYRSCSNVLVFRYTISVFKSGVRFQYPWCYALPFPFDLDFCRWSDRLVGFIIVAVKKIDLKKDGVFIACRPAY